MLLLLHKMLQATNLLAGRTNGHAYATVSSVCRAGRLSANGRSFFDPLYSFLAFMCIYHLFIVSVGSICCLV